jgi:hypothetical protein
MKLIGMDHWNAVRRRRVLDDEKAREFFTTFGMPQKVISESKQWQLTQFRTQYP